MASVRPARIGLQPFGLYTAQEQCVVWLDPADCGPLAAAAPQRLERLPASAAPQRQLEYLAARAAAAALLEAQGSACIEVGTGLNREPMWPRGFTGSITHSPDIAGVVAVRALPGMSIGIDTQALLDPAAAAEVASRCVHPAELHACGVSRQVLLTLLFSAREAFFKCVYPLAQYRLDFLDVQVGSIDAEGGRLRVCVSKSPAPGLPVGFALTGSFSVALSHVFTAFELRVPQAPTGW